MIRPVASATGMKRAGGTWPRESGSSSGAAPRRRRSLRCSSVDLRLVVHAELAALEPEPQLVLEPEQLAELACHVVLEDLVPAAAGLLGRVHRDVGVADQVLARPPIRPSWIDDADARAEYAARGRAIDTGSAEPLEQPLGDVDRLAARRRPSSRSANSSPPSRASVSLGRMTSLKRCRDLLEQLVAGVVTEAVVDLLEAVEIDEQHRERRRCERAERASAWSSRSRNSARLARSGEPVVERLARELLLEPHALGDVARVEHDAADVPVVAEVGDVRLEVAPLAEPVLHAGRGSRGARRRRGRLDERRDRRGATKPRKPSPSSSRARRGRASSVTDWLA